MTEDQTIGAPKAGEQDEVLRRLAISRLKRRHKFRLHVVGHVVGSLFLIVVWATTEYHNAGGWPTGFRTGRMNHDWDPWIMYPLIAGTLALALHAWTVFGDQPTTEDQISGEVDRLRRRMAA